MRLLRIYTDDRMVPDGAELANKTDYIFHDNGYVHCFIHCSQERCVTVHYLPVANGVTSIVVVKGENELWSIKVTKPDLPKLRYWLNVRLTAYLN